MSKIVLADIKGKNGFVNKDTIVGGFGARFKAFSVTTLWLEWVRRAYQNIPSIQMSLLASIFKEAGHDVIFTDGPVPEGDVAIILSSLVDYKNERYWARKFKEKNRHGKTGFIGLCATHLPHLFSSAADFIIKGEPEAACMELAFSEKFSGMIDSPEITDMDSLPFSDWEIFNKTKNALPGTMKSISKVIPMVSSRSCPERCSYCPHRIGGSYRLQSIDRLIKEIKRNYRLFGSHYIIFRDSNFTGKKDRIEEFMKELEKLGLDIYFEIETRLDTVDIPLLERLKKLGLKRMTFGVESINEESMRELGRRPVPDEHQRNMIKYCWKKGVQTQAFYIFGYLKDTVKSIVETTRYSLELDTTLASYKILTPFPGTKFYEEIRDKIFETDWEKFDGLNLTFHHPGISNEEMKFLLEHAYARFFARPSQYFRYRGNYGSYGQYKDLSDMADTWAHGKHDRLMIKSLKKNNMWKEDFLWR